jgi:hypothetical protein
VASAWASGKEKQVCAKRPQLVLPDHLQLAQDALCDLRTALEAEVLQ